MVRVCGQMLRNQIREKAATAGGKPDPRHGSSAAPVSTSMKDLLIQLFQLLISAFPLLNSALSRSTVKPRFSGIFKDLF